MNPVKSESVSPLGLVTQELLADSGPLTDMLLHHMSINSILAAQWLYLQWLTFRLRDPPSFPLSLSSSYFPQ